MNVLVLSQRKRKQFWADDTQLEYNVSVLICYGTRVRVNIKRFNILGVL